MIFNPVAYMDVCHRIEGYMYLLAGLTIGVGIKRVQEVHTKGSKVLDWMCQRVKGRCEKSGDKLP